MEMHNSGIVLQKGEVVVGEEYEIQELKAPAQALVEIEKITKKRRHKKKDVLPKNDGLDDVYDLCD